MRLMVIESVPFVWIHSAFGIGIVNSYSGVKSNAADHKDSISWYSALCRPSLHFGTWSMPAATKPPSIPVPHLPVRSIIHQRIVYRIHIPDTTSHHTRRWWRRRQPSMITFSARNANRPHIIHCQFCLEKSNRIYVITECPIIKKASALPQTNPSKSEIWRRFHIRICFEWFVVLIILFTSVELEIWWCSMNRDMNDGSSADHISFRFIDVYFLEENIVSWFNHVLPLSWWWWAIDRQRYRFVMEKCHLIFPSFAFFTWISIGNCFHWLAVSSV